MRAVLKETRCVRVCCGARGAKVRSPSVASHYCLQALSALYPAKHYGITGMFSKPLDIDDDFLVLQYG